MTKIEKFVEFTKTLSEEERAQVEIALESMMRSYAGELTLSDDQEAEIERRIADPNRQFADPAEINRILGRQIAS